MQQIGSGALTKQAADELISKATELFGATSAATERKSISMKFIRPSKKLVSDPLHFDPTKSPEFRRQGIQDFFSSLVSSGEISQDECRIWSQEVD